MKTLSIITLSLLMSFPLWAQENQDWGSDLAVEAEISIDTSAQDIAPDTEIVTEESAIITEEPVITTEEPAVEAEVAIEEPVITTEEPVVEPEIAAEEPLTEPEVAVEEPATEPEITKEETKEEFVASDDSKLEDCPYKAQFAQMNQVLQTLIETQKQMNATLLAFMEASRTMVSPLMTNNPFLGQVQQSVQDVTPEAYFGGNINSATQGLSTQPIYNYGNMFMNSPYAQLGQTGSSATTATTASNMPGVTMDNTIFGAVSNPSRTMDTDFGYKFTM